MTCEGVFDARRRAFPEDGAAVTIIKTGSGASEDGPGLVHRPGRHGHRIHRGQDQRLQQAQREGGGERRSEEGLGFS